MFLADIITGFLYYDYMNKKQKYALVKVPALVMVAFVVIIASQDAFAETEVTIPNEASDISCAESGSCFLPGEVTIGVGESVTWHNDSGVIHTVTSGNAEDGPDGVFDSSIIMSDDTFTHTFTETGQYEYFCSIHPWMTGTVIVV